MSKSKLLKMILKYSYISLPNEMEKAIGIIKIIETPWSSYVVKESNKDSVEIKIENDFLTLYEKLNPMFADSENLK